jgi:hypothetical protein
VRKTVVGVTAVIGLLHAVRSSQAHVSAVAAPAEVPLVVAEERCYVVCDMTEARVFANGVVTRKRFGQILGPGRVATRVAAADTVSVDDVALDSLRRTLGRYRAAGFPTDMPQGKPPCGQVMTSHTPVLSVKWQDADGGHQLRYDTGCREPSGLLDALVRYARRAVRLDDTPVKPQARGFREGAT